MPRFDSLLAHAILACGSLSATTITQALGGISFGVAPYGLPAQPGPVFIFNNATGQNDIMASPGGGFLLSSPIAVNNISQTGQVSVFNNILTATQVGGGNGIGFFGSGGGSILNNMMDGLFLNDASPGGGTLSYAIFNTVTTYTGPYVGGGGNLTVGAALPMGGNLPAFSAAEATSLQMSITDVTTGMSQTLPPLIIAESGNGNFVAVGTCPGFNGNCAAINVVFNKITGQVVSYSGLAVDNVMTNFVVNNGDTVRVTATVTMLSDPMAEINIIDIDPTLLGQIGGPGSMPSFQLVNLTNTPEPGTIAMIAAGLLAVAARSRILVRSRRKRSNLPRSWLQRSPEDRSTSKANLRPCVCDGVPCHSHKCSD